jgi:UDP-glucose 4-epimerase
MNTLKAEDIKTILIIGIAGGLAQSLCKRLHAAYPQAQIIGVDSRPLEPSTLPNVTYQTIRYSRGNFENLFRESAFDLVYHLGRVSHTNLINQLSVAERLDLNIIGTSRILDLCLKHEIKKIIILSTFHVYGALPDNPAFLNEETFLRASIAYPELRDVVEMDQLASSWMWKHQNHIQTLVLRPCNILGPQIKNTFSRYLLNPWTPTPMDFNPMFQFIHESDMAHALQKCAAVVPTGIYNIAPYEIISLKEARKTLGVPGVQTPLFILSHLAEVYKRFNPDIPNYLLDYLKYSCLIDTHAIRSFLGNDFCQYTSKDTLKQLKPAQKR